MAISTPEIDFVAYDKRGQAVLLVEAKSSQHTTELWAARFRRNPAGSRHSSHAPFFFDSSDKSVGEFRLGPPTAATPSGCDGLDRWRFGYSHQFGLIWVNYAKLLAGIGFSRFAKYAQFPLFIIDLRRSQETPSLPCPDSGDTSCRYPYTALRSGR